MVADGNANELKSSSKCKEKYQSARFCSYFCMRPSCYERSIFAHNSNGVRIFPPPLFHLALAHYEHELYFFCFNRCFTTNPLFVFSTIYDYIWLLLYMNITINDSRSAYVTKWDASSKFRAEIFCKDIFDRRWINVAW